MEFSSFFSVIPSFLGSRFFYDSVEFCRNLCNFTVFFAFAFFFYSVLARGRISVIFVRVVNLTS